MRRNLKSLGSLAAQTVAAGAWLPSQAAVTSSSAQSCCMAACSSRPAPHALRRSLSSYTGGSAGAGSGAPRRVAQPPRAGAAAAGEASSSTSGGGEAAVGAAAGATGRPMLAEMSREVAGGTKPLRSWEKWYWGVGVGGVSLWLFSRLRPDAKTPDEIEEEKRKAAELEVRRKDHLRAVLAGQGPGGFISEGDDPLNGLSPQQIEEFMAAAGIDPRDPLEGMSPEEIDEYMQRQQAASSSGDEGGGEGGSGSDGSSESSSGGSRGS